VIRRAASFAIRWSGLGWLIRRTYARNKVSIVLYHDPDPESLSRQLTYLGKRYTFIELDHLVSAIRTRDWSEMPPNAVVITLDDGHAGNIALRDVFREHGVRPTIFLCSQIVGTTRHFWFEDVEDSTAEALKPLATGDRLRELAERWDFDPRREYGAASRQALSDREVAEMGDCCTFGSHTRFHPILTSCSPEVVQEELVRSRTEVEALAGAPCRHFAYPNGSYSEREVRLAEEAGYDSARTVDIGWNHRKTDPYRLRILSVADGFPVNMLAADLAGLKWLSRTVRRQGRFDGRLRPGWEARGSASRKPI
jgi:peptidoglycan/xylan/chitin deacetylase (PgdA/CDA1 family)